MGVSDPPWGSTVGTPDAFAKAFASARPEADAVELAGAQRALRACLLERPSPALRLHRYELRGCLGGGGNGTVFEAFDPQLDRKVAIKVLRHRDENETGHENAQEQLLLSEARAMARASDPRVVAIYDVGRSPEGFLAHAGEPAGPSRVFIVMEHVEGLTLRRWLAGEVRLDQVVRIFLEAAAGLIAAHRSGVVHGDFKPENIMITPDHRVKILDFGIARVMGSGTGHLGFTGTPYYAAPEQLGGAAPDEKSDQYSFCRALQEAARRASPAGAVARDVAQILRRGLEASPERRFASMQELAAALAEVSRPTQRSSKLTPIALAVLAGIASGMAGEKIPSVPAGSGCIEAGLQETWNPARASRLEQAFRSTHLPYADDSWRSVVKEVGAYAAQFRQALGAACTLTQRSAALRCLEERHRVLDTMLAVMEERPNAVVPQAIDATFSLPAPGSCLSARDVPDSLPMPACAADVERELYALDAGLTAAFADGVSRSAMALTAAFQCAPKRLGPWAELVHGLHLLNAAQWADASTTLRAAFLAAEAAGDPRVAMRAMTGQIAAYERRGEVSHVDRLIEDGRARVDAVARELGPDLEALFFEEVARVRRRQGRYAEALEHALRAVELRKKHWGAHHPLTSRAQRHLADVYFKQRDFRAAETIGLTVLTDLSSYVGPHHPDMAWVQSLLGAIAWRRGFYHSADERFAEVQRIWTGLFGPDDPRAIDALRDRASVHVSAGQFSTAWSELEPVLASPPDPREDSVARANMALTAGEALTGMGRYDRAAELLDFAMAEYTRTKGPEGVVVGYTLIALGRLALARGNPMKAREFCGRAVEILHNRLDEGHPNLSWAYSCLGLAELRSGHDTLAAGTLEQARSLYDGNVDDPKNLAEIELHLKSARRDQAGPALALKQKLSNAAGGRSRE